MQFILCKGYGNCKNSRCCTVPSKRPFTSATVDFELLLGMDFFTDVTINGHPNAVKISLKSLKIEIEQKRLKYKNIMHELEI